MTRRWRRPGGLLILSRTRIIMFSRAAPRGWSPGGKVSLGVVGHEATLPGPGSGGQARVEAARSSWWLL